MPRFPAHATLALVLALVACQTKSTFDPTEVAVGPGGMVGNGEPLTSGVYPGGNDTPPAPRQVTPPDGTRPPDCDGACLTWCEAQALENPVNRGLCPSLWGVGMSARPINHEQACRRLFVDMTGRLPTQEELGTTCTGTWGEVVQRLMASDDFIRVNQRRAADRFLYSTQVVSVQRIYDMDRLVEKLHRGLVPYDLFASVASAHPVVTRRYADAGDTVEAVFRLFLGRPPFENEKADMARLFALWGDGYVDHPQLAMRLPDAFIRFRCLDEEGAVDPDSKGECASVLWGYNELIFTPDIRASYNPELRELAMWSGLLTGEEWAQLQTPGRILARDVAFWERAVDEVLEQYLGYPLGQQVGPVRDELVRFLLENKGDIRSVHFAVATSIPYLQSMEELGNPTQPVYRWTYGPMKQMDAEAWLDSMSSLSGRELASCDHRITEPQDLLESGSLAGYQLLQASHWNLREPGQDGQGGGVDMSYAQLARTLGGCPVNVVGGRFKVLSILTTSTQLNFVRGLCNPSLDTAVKGAPVERLLPADMPAARAVDSTVATEIARHQYRVFLGREPDATELTEAANAGQACALSLCKAEQFARPFCFALLSSAEALFY
ncbi:MAG: hypothetical protein L0Y66_01800 [Myxococcaceae bacterium]|nr:hypothetical protein [Myxococcaceae bacterium]